MVDNVGRSDPMDEMERLLMKDMRRLLSAKGFNRIAGVESDVEQMAKDMQTADQAQQAAQQTNAQETTTAKLSALKREPEQ